MRIMNTRRIWGCCLLLSIMAFLLYSTLLHASPPTRVARLSSLNGSVSFLAAGVGECTPKPSINHLGQIADR